MKTNQADFPVRAMCRVLDLSPSGYYAWLDREPSARAKRDEELTERIETVWHENRRVYGRPRIYADLKEAGERVGEKRVGRLMKQAERSSPELCVKVRGSSSMLLLGCLGDLLRFEKREIQVATFAPDRSSP